MDNSLSSKLFQLFEAHRVVFWYDAASEFAQAVGAIPLPEGAALVKATEYNDFALKHLVLSQPGQKFLLYFNRKEPPDEDNWLLDIQLANAVFRTDRAALILEELGLPQSFYELVKRHEAFFGNESRAKSARNLLRPDMTEAAFKNALLAVLAGEESYSLQGIVDKLAAECAAESNKLYKKINDCCLDGALWQNIAQEYGYMRDEPSIEDFCVAVFESSLARFEGKAEALSPAARALMRHWKDSSGFRPSFEALSGMAENELLPQKSASCASMDELLPFDDYRFVEEEILERLSRAVLAKTMTLEAIKHAAEKRRPSFWFSAYKGAYECLVLAKELLDGVGAASFEMESPEDGIKRYVEEWSRIDSAYRRFKYLFRADAAFKPFEAINDEVEACYTKGFLLPLAEEWTVQAKELVAHGWKAGEGIQQQRIFFHYYIKNLINRGCTAVAVISDALRYEIGEEIACKINASPQQKLAAQVSPLLAAAPTYTQLGMAALLPHKSLAMSADGSTVFADGMSTRGLEARKAVLRSAAGEKAACIDADSLLKLKKDELKAAIRDSSVIYICHDRIDREGERDLFNAAAAAVDELIRIVERLASCGAGIIYVTADHGFIFQESELEPHQYISCSTVRGRDVNQVSGRRCAVGYELEASPSLAVAPLANMGLANEDGLEAAFPNAMLRLRVQGAASNFVHGGLSLQEAIVPLIKIEKAKKDGTRDAQLEVLTRLKAITTGSVTVSFYQKDAVSEKARGFEAEFGFYSRDGEALSNIEKRAIASDAADPKRREFSIVFYFNKASEKYNRQPIFLRVCKILPSGRKQCIKEKECTLSRSMSLDFDLDGI